MTKTVPLARAKPGDLVDLGPRDLARLLSTAPNGTIYLQPEGYTGHQYIMTINPTTPDGVRFIPGAK